MLVVQRLTKLGTPASRATLRELSRGPTETVRRFSVKALAEDPDKDAIPDLLAMLADEDADTRSWAAQGLGTLRYAPAVPQIIPMLESRSTTEKVAAAKALARIGDDDGVRHWRREWRPWFAYSYEPDPSLPCGAPEATAPALIRWDRPPWRQGAFAAELRPRSGHPTSSLSARSIRLRPASRGEEGLWLRSRSLIQRGTGSRLG